MKRIALPLVMLSLGLAAGAAAPAPRAKGASAKPALFSSRDAFHRVAPHPLTGFDFDTLLGTPDYPSNYIPKLAFRAPAGPINFRAFRIDGGAPESGEQNYLFSSSQPNAWTMNGTGAVASGPAFVEILAQGATAFAFDFGVDTVKPGAFTLRFEFEFKDGTRLVAERTGVAGQAQFIAAAGKPIDRVTIANLTPPRSDGTLPLILIDNVLTTVVPQ